jgi:hypothetical protein
MLRSTTVILLVILAAPQPTALWHVGADSCPLAKHKLTLLIVGKLLTCQHCVSILLNHIAMRLIQQTGALIFSVIPYN